MNIHLQLSFFWWILLLTEVYAMHGDLLFIWVALFNSKYNNKSSAYGIFDLTLYLGKGGFTLHLIKGSTLINGTLYVPIPPTPLIDINILYDPSRIIKFKFRYMNISLIFI